MELKEGIYIRSKINGTIGKITDIEQFEELGQIVERYILDNNYNVGFCSTEKDSVIASCNIIDLIEVGDYVNGKLVARVNECEGSFYQPNVQCRQDERYDYEQIFDDEIKSIVTKEQFESMSYKVDDAK